MNDQERADAKAELSQVCYELGCSKLSSACPGDPYCQIIRRLFAGNIHATNMLVVDPSQPKLFEV